jgi:hypothetical protein
MRQFAAPVLVAMVVTYMLLVSGVCAQEEFPPYPTTSQAPATPQRRQVTTPRVPNAQTEPRAYYDYCTSAAAYWKERADKARLPAELYLQNTAMENVAAYRNAASAVQERAFATPTPRPTVTPTQRTLNNPGVMGMQRMTEDDLPGQLSPADLKQRDKVTAWINRLVELRVITVLHVHMDEAQVDSDNWAQLKFDMRRTIASALAVYMKFQGRSGSGMIIDQHDGAVLAVFTPDAVQVARPGITLTPLPVKP